MGAPADGDFGTVLRGGARQPVVDHTNAYHRDGAALPAQASHAEPTALPTRRGAAAAASVAAAAFAATTVAAATVAATGSTASLSAAFAAAALAAAHPAALAAAALAAAPAAALGAAASNAAAVPRGPSPAICPFRGACGPSSRRGLPLADRGREGQG